DRLQQLIDRRFYREKYQLDKALQRMNRAVGHVVDRETLAHPMIGSCRDVLRVDRIAVYLRDAARPSFQLIAVEGRSDLPAQIVADDDLMQTLRQEPAVARSVTASGNGFSSVQQTLRSLRAELMYAFESVGEIAGVVVLGPKQSGTVYTAEDLTFLNALGQITSVALHSVKVHQDIARLNDEMQLKVEKIDEQRRVISMLQQEIKTTQGGGPSPTVESVAVEFQRGHIKGNSPAIQRVLETVGGARTVKVDVRLIAATNQDLKRLIIEGKFREDLFYRLNVISIALPTLAERKEDILELALYFLKRSSEKLGKRLSQIDDDTLVALKRHSWPGNIRELENVIERADVLAEGETVTLAELPH